VTVEDAGASSHGTGTSGPGSRWAALGWTLLGLLLIALLVISLTQCQNGGPEPQPGRTGIVGWTTRVPWLSPTLVAILVGLLIWVTPIAIKRVIMNLRPRDADGSEGIPSTLRSSASRPEQILPELGALTERLEAWTSRASSHQSDYLALGRQLIVLSQLAVLLLILQLVLQPAGHASCGRLLIGGEFLCLVLVLRAVVFTARPTKEWVQARVRAELLRREQFLAVSGVGPYLIAEDLAERVRVRLHELESREPMQTIALAAEGGGYRDRLEDARLDEHQGRRGMARLDRREQAIVAYLVHRLQDQLEYYERRSREHRYLDERFDRGMKYVLFFSVAAAAIHLLLALLGSTPPLAKGVEVLAIVLPPLGIALYSLRGLYEWRRLGRAYHDQFRTLQRIRNQLLELHARLPRAQPPAELVIMTPTVLVDATVLDTRAMTELSELEFKFRRLVLEAEELFAAELRQWYVLVRAEHAPGPV
jgi:hypothetical protein